MNNVGLRNAILLNWVSKKKKEKTLPKCLLANLFNISEITPKYKTVK